MSPVDIQIITRKAKLIEVDLAILAKNQPKSYKQYLKSATSQLIIERLLERIVGKMIDINYHLLSERCGFVPNNYTRFHRPRIDKNQELPPSNIVKIEEWIAGIAPFIAVVPEKSQDRIEAFFANDVLAEGQVARVEGVVIQQNYSNPLLDAFGLSRYLRHPDIGIHIYDESGAFAQKINMHFIDTKTAKRIDTINDQETQMTPDQIATQQERLNRVFTALEEDGVTERLVENQHSIGQIADIRGLSVIDLAEICLKYKSEHEWLENTDLNSIANITPTQLAV